MDLRADILYTMGLMTRFVSPKMNIWMTMHVVRVEKTLTKRVKLKNMKTTYNEAKHCICSEQIDEEIKNDSGKDKRQEKKLKFK